MDLKMSSKKHFFSPKSYFKMIREKTSALFETACRVGSIIGGAKIQDEQVMANFGRNLGIAFQMIDDVLGAVGDPRVTGKPVGSDLREGKKTYVISLAIKLANEDNKLKILGVLGKRDGNREEIDEVLTILSKTGAIDKVKGKAKFYSNKALSNLKRYPNSSSKKVLSELTDFIVTRNL